MKGSGQFGAPELQQYMVSERGATPPSHMFMLSSSPHHLLHPQQRLYHSLLPPPPPPQLQQQAYERNDPGHRDLQSEQKHEDVVGHDDTSHYNIRVAGAAADPCSGGEQEEVAEDGERGTHGNHRWPRQETVALLKIRSEMDSTFRDSNMKSALWEDVSRKMGEIGYNRNASKCKEKFENVHKYYKRTKEGKSGRQGGKSYKFYSQLEALYGKPSASSRSINKNGGKISRAEPPSIDAELPAQLLLSEAIHAEKTQGQDSEAGHRSGFEHGRDLHFSSSSSQDGNEGPTAGGSPESRKRKRKSRFSQKFMLFFEALVKRVLGKQEEMQMKLLEALERREHERAIRDEAWRRQEMARLSKEHELRAQESSFAATKDAALISFLQKITEQQLDQDLQEKDNAINANAKRWPELQIHALIKLRMELDGKFQEPGPKTQVWEEISSKLCNLGYNHSAKRCKEKWENINKYFKKAKESNKSGCENSRTCTYFQVLDALYSQGLLGKKQLGCRIEAHSELVLHQPNESNKDEESGHGEGGDSHFSSSNSREHATKCDGIGLDFSKMASHVINFASSGNDLSFSQDFDGVAIEGNAQQVTQKDMHVSHKLRQALIPQGARGQACS